MMPMRAYRKNMQRFLCVVAAIFFAVSLTACEASYSEEDLAAAKDEGYDSGYAEGYSDAETDHENDYDDGYVDGYDEGYADAENKSKSLLLGKYGEGYADGYADGCEDAGDSGDTYEDYTASSYTYEEPVQQTYSETVYVTNTGSKYHRAGCQYLRDSQIAIDLDDAIAAGYTACSRCY